MTVTLHLPALAEGAPFRAAAVGLAARFRTALAALLAGGRRRRALAELGALSERELRDIGLARGELLYLECASRRGPFRG